MTAVPDRFTDAAHLINLFLRNYKKRGLSVQIKKPDRLFCFLNSAGRGGAVLSRRSPVFVNTAADGEAGPALLRETEPRLMKKRTGTLRFVFSAL